MVQVEIGTYLLLAQEYIQGSLEDGLQAGTDNVEWETVVLTVLVELLETRVQRERLLHNHEAVVEGDIEGSPHVLGDLTVSPLAVLHLFFQLGQTLLATAVGTDEDVASVFHEDGAIEIYCRVSYPAHLIGPGAMRTMNRGPLAETGSGCWTRLASIPEKMTIFLF